MATYIITQAMGRGAATTDFITKNCMSQYGKTV